LSRPRGSPRTAKRWWVYLLELRDGRLYTGITTDLARRVAQHRAGTGSRMVRSAGVKRLAYAEWQPNHSAALRREAAIKRWTRKRKLALVARARGRGIG